MARLGDLCCLINGDRGKNYPSQAEISSDGEIPFINAGHIVGGKLDFSDMNYISEEKYNQLNSGKIQENDVLYCLRGSLGKKAIVKDIPKGAIASSLVIIRPDIQRLNSDYLFYALESPTVQEQMMQANNGSSQPNLSAKSVSDYTFNLPDIKEQLVIVSKLAKVNELIAIRKEQLAKLDQLVKSRFTELFGDPMTNPMGWDEVNISAVVGGRVSNGFFAKREDYCADGNVKVLGVAYVVNRMYSNTEDLPTTNGSETDIVKYGVKYGDMLFCRSSLVAAGIGKASIVPKNTPNNVLFECHVIRLPLDLEKCVPEFMQVLSTTDYFRNQVIAQSKTATMTTIGQDGILKTGIILPPMEMQKKFLAFVEQTQKSKLAIQQSLDKLELLKNSLMQEYFG